ncbi:2TM domain-containing protein [Rhodocytophaga aerolata]|uniref:2TM domain-containing protein n=1 Tax=Rhodocytophaga aerolata TaxID=455078 RepID=A0ABT8R5M2_9BACT|nr:2TM domain-containing protein [Rhodocytophaga aerolata]MDO1447395.1 2TM domain-containing protein [Rhodocytophaga aerolata]
MNRLTYPYTEELKKIHKIKLFYTHATIFLIVNTLLFILNMATNPAYLWFWWPLFFWTKGIVLHALSTFDTSPGMPAEDISPSLLQNNSNK